MSNIYSPITGEVIAQVADSTLSDVDNALERATASFDKWRKVNP